MRLVNIYFWQQGIYSLNNNTFTVIRKKVMPVIDLGDWPEKENVVAIYILWARMAFPHDPKLRKQFTALRLADLKADSKIPPKKNLLTKDIPREIIKLLCDIGSGIHSAEPKDSLKTQFIKKGGIRTLINAPRDKEMLDIFASSFYQGKIAGEILLLLKQMNEAKIRWGASVNKAVHILEKLNTENYKKLGQPSNRRYFHESFQKYKSVAHLWGAYCLSRNSKKYSDKHKPRSNKGLIGFLNIAEDFRGFATTFIPHGRREPIILENESLRPPKNLPPLTTNTPIPPLNKKQLEAIDDYRAPN